MPRLLGVTPDLGLLAPVKPVRTYRDPHWRAGIAGPPLQADVSYRPISRQIVSAAAVIPRHGWIWLPRVPPAAIPPPPGVILQPVEPVRMYRDPHWRAASAGFPPTAPEELYRPIIQQIVTQRSLTLRRGSTYQPHLLGFQPPPQIGLPPRSVQTIGGSHPTIPGTASVPRVHLPETPIVHPWAVLQVTGGRPPRPGQVSHARILPATAAAIQADSPYRPIIRDPSPQLRLHGGRIALPRIFPAGAPPVPYTPLHWQIAWSPPGRFLYRRNAGKPLRYTPAPLLGISPEGYYIYSNTGSGPINYNTPIATIYGYSNTTWTSSPLAHPDTWMFGVRAFNGAGIELNLDASITLILDALGHDITNRPKPPFGLRAFPMAGGALRVEWAYNTINPSPVPTGFHVYVGIGSPNYGSPDATVPFTSAVGGTFVANLPPLSNGVTYTIGVRAYNGTAEEPNTVTVTATADSSGPLAVSGLSGLAIT
jgi:hypothetical protein